MTILHLYKNRAENPGFEELLQRLNSVMQNVVVENAALLQDDSNISLMHAHSWFEDGPDALNLKLERNIPYVVSLCDEDLLRLQKFSLKSKRFDILEQAEKVIFPNPMFQNILAEKLSNKLADQIFSHSWIIYNGLMPFWFQHLRLAKPVSLIHTRLLTLENNETKSELSEIKKAMNMLRKRNLDVDLTTFDGSKMSEMERMELYQKHDVLVVPSLSGVKTTLYVEALSQGLPVIYGKRGCFDGIFQDGIPGFAVNGHNASEIMEKIVLISERYATIEQHIASLHPLQSFNYDEIYRQYLRIYDIG